MAFGTALAAVVASARARGEVAGVGALARVASRHGERRVRAIGLFEAGALNEDALLEVIEGLSNGDYEIGCRPGHDVRSVPEHPEWTYEWDHELAALCSKRVRDAIDARGIRLINYADV